MEAIGIAIGVIAVGVFLFLLDFNETLRQRSKDKVKIAEEERKTAEAMLETERLKSTRQPS